MGSGPFPRPIWGQDTIPEPASAVHQLQELPGSNFRTVKGWGSVPVSDRVVQISDEKNVAFVGIDSGFLRYFLESSSDSRYGISFQNRLLNRVKK